MLTKEGLKPEMAVKHAISGNIGELMADPSEPTKIYWCRPSYIRIIRKLKSGRTKKEYWLLGATILTSDKVDPLKELKKWVKKTFKPGSRVANIISGYSGTVLPDPSNKSNPWTDEIGWYLWVKTKIQSGKHKGEKKERPWYIENVVLT